MFTPLPNGFPRLQQTIAFMDAFALSAPPDMEDIGRKIRRLVEQARATGYQGMSLGVIRRLPYALWLDGKPHLSDTDPQMYDNYWRLHLPAALASGRKAKRWLAPLFFIYCHAFKRQDPAFLDLAARIRQSLDAAEGAMAQWLRDLHARHDWFMPDKVGLKLGDALLQPAARLRDTVAAMNLWPGFLEEAIASEAFVNALGDSVGLIVQESIIEKLKGWALLDATEARGPSTLRYPEHRAALADGLVRPWLGKKPPDQIRQQLLSFLLKQYGDPRLVTEVHRGHHWQGVSVATLDTVKRWLAGDTLRGFMRILELTADENWRYRERFWMAYYDLNLVDEAWLALGQQAALHARRVFGPSNPNSYGRLTSGALPQQSVLFLRIGHLVFTEWSHSGSLRACQQGDPHLPAMYQSEYHGAKVREIPSMDFHSGMNQNPQLSHMNSEGGTWQRKARDFIAHHTGVRLNDQTILG